MFTGDEDQDDMSKMNKGQENIRGVILIQYLILFDE